jgi:hypothetical protein
MKALLINPQARTITEVDYNGDYKHIYTLIDSALFDIVRIDAKETIFVDDEGLVNGKAQTVGMFRVAGRNPVVLAGKGLVLSTDTTGDSIATTLTIEQLTLMIDFVEPVRVNGVLVFWGEKAIYRGDDFSCVI